MITTCTRRLEWDAMHRVPDHDGACRAFHGHRYVAEITCDGVIADDGMIVDFGIIKRVVGNWIDENWDHTAILYKNDPDPAVKMIAESNAKYGKPVYYLDQPPTAENISIELFRITEQLLGDQQIRVVRIRVFETPNCSAETMRKSAWA